MLQKVKRLGIHGCGELDRQKRYTSLMLMYLSAVPLSS